MFQVNTDVPVVILNMLKISIEINELFVQNFGLSSRPKNFILIQIGIRILSDFFDDNLIGNSLDFVTSFVVQS